MRGFTLIELLVVLVLVVIVTTWAIPSYQSLMARQRISVEVMRLMGALGQARSTAVMRRAEVVVCPTADRFTCEGDWMLPLMLFIDEDGSPGGRADDEVILKTWPASEVASLTYNGFGSQRYIRYRANGRPRGHNGTYTLCTEGHSTEVIMSASGRVRAGRVIACQ